MTFILSDAGRLAAQGLLADSILAVATSQIPTLQLERHEAELFASIIARELEAIIDAALIEDVMIQGGAVVEIDEDG